MTGSLSPDQLDHYRTNGFVNRIPVFSAEEAAGWLAELEAIERAQIEAHGEWKQRDYRPWEHGDHPMRDFIDRLARHPAVLDAVESILGPDILVRNVDVFLKEPGLKRGIAWHIDTAEQGPDADLLLTAWIGLSASTEENGGLHYAAGSHRQALPDAPTDKWSLTLKPTAVAALDPARTVVNTMEPGMMSLHHFRLVHASGPNRSTSRRVGFVCRFMSPAISQATAESGVATLVRGQDRYGHFGLKPHFPLTWTK